MINQKITGIQNIRNLICSKDRQAYLAISSLILVYDKSDSYIHVHLSETFFLQIVAKAQVLYFQQANSKIYD